MSGVCAIVGAGPFNEAHFGRLYREGAFAQVIAADGGFAHLERAGVAPDAVLGDFDSLGYVPAREDVEVHPVRKDATDMELAMERAVSAGFRELAVYGCLGGARIDLSLALVQLLGKYARRGVRVFAVGERMVATALAGAGGQDAGFQGARGEMPSTLSFRAGARGTLSVFALSDEARGVVERGLSYTLEGATLVSAEPLGVSNELTGAPALVSVAEGALCVFFPVDAWDARE